MVSLIEDPYLIAVSGPTKAFAVNEGRTDIGSARGLPFISKKVLGVGPISSGNMKENTFMRRERVVGSSIYSKSAPVVRVNGKPFELSEGSEVSSLKVGDSVELSCSKGTVPQMLIQQGSLRVQIDGKSPETFTDETILSGMNEGVKFQVMEVEPNKGSWGLHSHDIQCLDVQKLDKAMRAFNAVPFNRSGRYFSFQGNKGEIYRVRVPYSEKWGAAELRNVDEFLAIVPKDGGTISCKYQITGLTTGVLISVIACALAGIFYVVDRRTS